LSSEVSPLENKVFVSTSYLNYPKGQGFAIAFIELVDIKPLIKRLTDIASHI